MDLTAHHIGLVVTDLERAKAFYECLGFEVESSLDLEGGSRSLTFVRLGGFSGEFRIELFWYAETPPALPGGESKHIGFRHLAFKTADLDATLAELKLSGLVADDVEVREVAGRYRLLFLGDPDGTEIEVMQEL